MSDQTDGRLEEYKILRIKAQEMVKRLDDLERNAIIACSAIFVFSVSTHWPNPIAKEVLYFLPTALSWFGFLKYWGLASYLGEVNRYAAHIEPEVLGRPGWLTAYYSESAAKVLDPPLQGEGHFASFRMATWIVLSILTPILGTLLTLYGPV